MHLENKTPFSALSYAILDPRGEEWHVVVARGTYHLRAPAKGESPETPEGTGGPITHVVPFALTQAEIVVSDAYYGVVNASSVKHESDLAPRKPRCDVVVIGAAHSPTGEPVPRVDVRVRIRRLEPIENLANAGTLLDHHLAVHGARLFHRRAAGAGWALGDAEPFVELPLRYEHAFGGELKVYAEDEAAQRLDDAHRLSEEARRGHPERRAAPVAHATCMENPLGVGYLERWYADAAEVDRWPAPRIEAPGAGITAEVFGRMVEGKVRPGEVPELSPRGVGVIAKPWQPRLSLAGTFDAAWLAERWPLMPPEFDMAYWNGAHPDMQCEHLYGGEVVELWNVLPATSHALGAARDAAGTVCRFEVPISTAAARFSTERGAARLVIAPVDTIIVDLEEMRVSMVWRALSPASLGEGRATLLALADTTEQDAA